MKGTWLLAGSLILSSVLVGAGMLFEPACAQQQQRPTVPLAVVNVSKVFESYTKYHRLVEGFKADVEAAAQAQRTAETTIKAKMEALKSGSITNKEDRDRIEKEVADLRFEFAKNGRELQQTFAQREAQIIATVYKDLSDLLTWYCEQNGIHVVLRYDDDGDAPTPQAAYQKHHRQVVYCHPNLDLTAVMIEGMNRQSPQ